MATQHTEAPHWSAGQSQPEVPVNEGLDRLDESNQGTYTEALSGGGPTNLTDDDALGNYRFVFTGTISGTHNVVAPDNVKRYLVINNTSGGTLVFKNSGTGVTLSAGSYQLLYSDGTNMVDISPSAGGTPTTFDALTDVSESGAAQGQMVRYDSSLDLVNENVPYDIGIFAAATPDASSEIARLPVPRAITFPANFATPNSYGSVRVAPTGASVTFTVKRDGTQIGTVQVSTAGVFTFATDSGTAKSFTAGQVLTVEAPSNLRSLADLGIGFAGTRD